METAKGLEFDAAKHEYHFRGRRAPGVTSVLEPYNGLEHVDPDHLAMLAEFGTHVHDAVHLYNIGELDQESLSPALVPYLDGWKAYLEFSGALVVYSEARVYSKKMNYAGTLDTIVSLGKIARLIDLKTGDAVPRTVGPQTAAYNEAWHEMTGQRRMNRACVHLTGKGLGFKIINLPDPNDWNIYKAALTLHRWKFGD